MTSPPPRIATLDACILYQGVLTDLLLWISAEGAVDPIWSPLITLEWTRNLSERLDATKVQRRAAAMAKAFPAASVAAASRDVATIQEACQTARQRKDAHVIATAVQAQAATIVTHNISDFHHKVLAEYGLVKRRPDTFLVELMSTHQAQVITGVKAHRASLKAPSLSVHDYLEVLAGPKGSVPKLSFLLDQSHRADI